ncbi:MAG: ABC transporter ATP-binding protein [bacterium]|nr:ABC transporter ATP-binding protein [bacterium]
MKQLFKFLAPYRKESILGPLFKLLEASFELLVPMVMKAIIDTGINGGGGRPYIVKMCIVLIALGLIGMLCSFTAQFFAAKAATGFAADVRHALFKHLEGLSFTEIDRIGTSTMITRMTSDVNLLQNGVNLTLRLLLRSPFVVIGAMIMAFMVDFKAALVFAVVIPVLAVIVFGIMLITMPIYKRAQKALDAVLKSTRENLGGIRVIRAFCKEYSETNEFNAKNEALADIQKYVGKISALMNPVTYVVINAAVIVLIYVGALRVESGVLLQGGVVALYNYMSQILVELIKLANMIISLTKAIAGGNRVADVLNEKSTLVNGTLKNGSSGGSVEFKNVTLVYSGSKEASLEDISFEAKPGETIGIIGGTGSGKSSLVHLIPRFYDAASGSVTVDGTDVREYDVNALRDKIGIVMQKAVLFKGSIRDNIRWGKPNASDDEIKEAIAAAQASEVINDKEGGLDYELEQGGKNLSGGQRQRMTIARALVKKPEILILDDSASALDFATDAALRKAIRDMDNAPTTFIVSQRAASVMYADKIIVLDDGRMAGIGTHDELLDSCDIYSEIYYSQFPKEVRG